MSESEKKQKKSPLMLILLILLGLSNAATLYLLYSERQVNVELVTQNTDLGVEKDKLTIELQDMLSKYDSVDTENEEMNAQIAEQKAEIERLLEEAEKHKDDAWAIYKLRKEATTLRSVMKNYLVTIDSLNTVNQNLVQEKAQVQTQLAGQKQKNEELNEENEELAQKVKIGSKLKAVDLVSQGQRVKSNNIHRETDRAKRTDKIKTCFTIDKNEVIKPGKVDVFLRIIGPDGEVLAFDQTQDYMFTYDGKEGLYSRKEEIVYENDEVDLCYYWDLLKEAKAGKYLIEVYAQDYLMGTTKFELK
ncbi:MAG: hypothetical protein HN542_01615 [Flavobacteriales bacterium]|jgi:cell division protein FtsL|nr:hypothetical protein [Flavobacteriales bacterium]MBT3963107.1 hypothetical protein [Flavobacteriales bacterium]MBT4706071.1 hypothetical protein [Flavobacteriales bacterium]MBT4930682.1 hypothetical protein [Flavobacteriales bacterium]MBT5133362.1 hypothetical protein [Flavobacteriales bacterium]